ncbi:hypothetical protein DLAC_11760 [Tieghemostelium lacteum]|uniref:Transmembrane protein n=1 Tax=Tieghemostelium lacteum TaxID=361077 RepID=A0A151Z9B2_TIELA|nr:hypothetical protein DLAC_11760 [Tieghemostelium lacteum]|eukprot:KYQ90513.1 hypothetical protein DLAC_11760 [Tieghemostelium lacteum]
MIKSYLFIVVLALICNSVISTNLQSSSSENVESIYNNFILFQDDECENPLGVYYSGIFDTCFYFPEGFLPFSFIVKKVDKNTVQFNIFDPSSSCFDSAPLNSTDYDVFSCKLAGDAVNEFYQVSQTPIANPFISGVALTITDENSNVVGLVNYQNNTFIGPIDNSFVSYQYYCDQYNTPQLTYCFTENWGPLITKCSTYPLQTQTNVYKLTLTPSCI